MLSALFLNVQRAGPVFTGQTTLRPEGEGYHMTLQLAPHAFNKNDVGTRVQRALGSYIRSYLRENGWRVKNASFKRTYFELFAAPATSRAASSASKNP
jgi:hypothetical protein